MNQLAFIRSDLQSMSPYVVQDAPGMIKLDAMENPYTLPDDLKDKLGQALSQVALNRYPAESIHKLHDRLKTYADLPSGYGLVLGNGSDELISLLAMSCLKVEEQKPNSVLAPAPSFVMYQMSAQFQGLRFVGVPLTPDFELHESAMLDAIRTERPALTYIAYPNNPTANLWDASSIRNIIAMCKTYDGLVVIDEAYQPFSERTWLDEIRSDPTANSHVLLMRTLSKFGLAGVRVGYLISTQNLTNQIEKLRPPYNVSSLNAECALFALEHNDVFAQQAALICRERTRLLNDLAKIPGIAPYPSQANMILVRCSHADSVFERLKTEGILVKNVSRMHPLLSNCLRLTVGTPQENNQLLATLHL